MMEPEKDPEAKQPKKPKPLRDLKPLKEVNGGARKPLATDKRLPAEDRRDRFYELGLRPVGAARLRPAPLG